MEDIKKNEGNVTALTSEAQSPGKNPIEDLKRKYDNKVYRVGATIEVDDETEKNVEYFFKWPSTGSFDRYVKTTSAGATKALKTFLFDNVTDESRSELERDLEEYPALVLTIGEKLLGQLGLSKQTNLKKL